MFSFKTSKPAATNLSAPVISPATSGESVAIIGTAGRDKSRPMTVALWRAMCDDLKRRLAFTDRAISGGAAWADHLAVHAYLNGWISNLTLHLPAPLLPSSSARRGFDDGGYKRSAGSVSTYYHRLFSQAIGLDTIAQLYAAIEKGATVTQQPAAPGFGAMFARNSLVAAEATGVIAYTWGDTDQPADGGTLNTWQQIRSTARVHVRLGQLDLHAARAPADATSRPTAHESSQARPRPTFRFSSR